MLEVVEGSLAPSPDLPVVVAGIVVYHPEAEQLRRIIAVLKPQVARVLLFLNSALPDEIADEVGHDPTLTIIAASGNLGIGVALNMLGLAASLLPAEAIVFFDQDSRPPNGLVADLCRTWQNLEIEGERPATVCPRLVAGPGSKAPTYRWLDPGTGRSARRAAFVPTSGSLITIDALRRVGFFRADYFIDGIDLEWSFRAASRGLSSWVETACTMPHAVGAGVIGSRRLGWHMPRQRPFRMYCTVRNTLYGLRLPHVPLAWKLRQLLYLPVQIAAYGLHHRARLPILRLLAWGVLDGLQGRLGPPRGLPADP